MGEWKRAKAVHIGGNPRSPRLAAVVPEHERSLPLRVRRRQHRVGELMNMRIRLLKPIFMGLLLLLASLPVRAGLPQGKNQVLIIHSYHSGLTWTDAIMSGIRDTLVGQDPSIQLTAEYLDARRYPEPRFSTRIRELVLAKIQRATPNLVMVADNQALDLILEQGQHLFPGVPIVFCGINDVQPTTLARHPAITGVAEELSVVETVDLALRLHPDTKKIIVIGRSTVAADKLNRESFVAALPKLPQQLQVRFWDDLPGPELAARLEKLDSGSVLFINGLISDETGRQMMYGETTAWISRHSNVPAYSLWDVYLGHGIVGGKLVSGYRQGQMAGHLALRILNGERIERIPVIAGVEANRYMVDYRQLERFRIPLAKLPPDTIVINRPDSLYDTHKELVWATVLVVTVLGVLVVLLGVAVVHQRRAERALQRSEEQMRLFFERQIVGMAITSPDKGWLQVNDRFCRMTGYSREELELLDWAKLTHPDDLAADLNLFGRLLAGEINDYALEKRFLRKDGTTIVVNLSVGCVRDERGAMQYVLGVVEDITERKRAEESLRQSQEFLSSILENLPNMIFIKDAKDLRFVRFNRAGEELLGYRREDLIGKNDYDFFPTEQADFFIRKDREVLKGGQLVDIAEEVIDTRAGRRILHTKKIPVMGDNGSPAYLLGISEDITERQQAAEEREKLREQLSQAQKLESVGRLAGGVAHDFNNMLSAILGHAELAMRLCAPNDPIHARLEVIEQSALRSADLVSQLLAFARKQTVAPKVLDMNETAASLLRMLQRLMGEDIDLVWIPKIDLWPIKIDPSQIDQLLANLCVNARDAISGVGKVVIETGNATFDASYCAVHPDFVPGEYVMLAVSDNGDGMDKDTLAHIFEPFFTTKEPGKGTGLGLATVYGIVKQNNGFIHVYSEPAKGTTFKIYLPRFAGENSDPLTEPGAHPPKGHGETVLLVEDEAMILDVGREMLETLGYTVLTANTPGEAIDQATAHPGGIQLVVTDVVMPEMNGRDLAHALRAIRPGLKYLFASGYTADIIAHHGVLDEGVVFIQKPFSIHNLAAKVREALERE